jgi:CYTH domain-containing protein
MTTSVNKEIEKRYFVNPKQLKSFLRSTKAASADGSKPWAIKVEKIEQYYIAKSRGNTVRLRISRDELGEIKCVLCIKGGNDKVNEVETLVPYEFAKALVENFSYTKITKTRKTVDLHYKGLKLEIDVFSGLHKGLIIAEIEVPKEDFQFKKGVLPPFLEKELDSNESRALSNFGLSLIETREAFLGMIEDLKLNQFLS